MDAETGFMLDGKIYEVPTLGSLTMGERRVMFELSGITQEDFAQDEDETKEEYDERTDKIARNPGFIEALMRIAYQRGNPGLKPNKVKLVIDRTPYLEAIETLGDDDAAEEPEVPLALTSEPAGSSENGSLDNNNSTAASSEHGGTSSGSGSEEPGSLRASTTDTRSGTSSTSALTSSAA